MQMRYLCSTLLALAAAVSQIIAQSNVTAFTYQGLLTANGALANGVYDCRVKLLGPNGDQRGPTLIHQVSVAEGLFILNLDFGAALLSGADGEPLPAMLEIGMRPQGGQTDFEVIGPPQPLLPAPYAVNAILAAQSLKAANNSVSSDSIQNGAITGSKVSEGAISGGHILNGQVVKSLNGLRDNLSLMGSEDISVTTTPNGIVLGVVKGCKDYTNCYWNLRGNGNTTDGLDFLGTVNSTPLSLRVNNQRVMRYENSGASPNLIGGHNANSAIASVGVNIGGGGYNIAPNVVSNSDYAVISGGANQRIRNGPFGGIGSGESNLIAWASSATIGGGAFNLITNGAHFATIGGGARCTINSNAYGATVGGGVGNLIDRDARFGVLGGGTANRIEVGAGLATIGGGASNRVQLNAGMSTISGGFENLIQTGVQGGTISGGIGNSVGDNAHNAAIGGGATNLVWFSAANATIGGGAGNWIRPSATFSTVGGGNGNVIQTGATASTVSGGRSNLVSPNVAYAAIPGGRDAACTNYGQQAYASGQFDEPGDAQTSLYVLRGFTNVQAVAELTLDGAGQRIKLRPGSTVNFEVQVSARSDDGLAAGYKFAGVIENSAGGVAAFVGSPDMLMVKEEAGAVAWDVTASAESGALVVRAINGDRPTRWVATVRTTEVKW